METKQEHINFGYRIIKGEKIYRFSHSRMCTKSLDYYLKLYNINLDDYYIYKSTSKQKQVTINEFLEFKYACYILFDKSVYDKNDIDYIITEYSFLFLDCAISSLLRNYKTLNIKKVNSYE